jgi:hypothetical protein
MALDGFQTSTVDVPVSPGAETIVAEVLRVAPVTEAVVVRAAAPPAPAPSPPPPPPEPPYQVRPISRLDLALVCGPAKPPRAWAPVGTLAGHPRDASRILFRTGDEVTLDAAPGTVLEVGQNLVARRVFPLDRPSAGNALGEYTAGVLQVSSVRAAGTTAVIMHACGELQKGDLLVPFPVEPLLIADPIGTPVFEDAARILFGEPGHMMGAPGRMLVIDRGRLHGIRQGQRLTIFRSSRGQRTVVGGALVLVVREDSARILVESATDAVWFGDMAAPQRPGRQTDSRR